MYSYIKCEICNMRTRNLNGKKRSFMAKLPKNQYLCVQWLKMIGKEELLKIPFDKLRYKYVCGDHFKLQDFYSLASRLKPDVVPSVGLQLPPLSDEQLDRLQWRPVLHHELPGPHNIRKPANVKILKKRLIKNPSKVCVVNPNASTSSVCISAPPQTLVSEEITPNAVSTFKKKNHLKDFYENFDTSVSTVLPAPIIKNKIGNEKKTLILNALLKKNVRKVRPLKDISNKIKTECGIYPTLLTYLRKISNLYKVLSEGKTISVLLFDELILDEGVTYNPCMDKIDGYVDLGAEGGRSDEIADRVLVFMLQNITMEVKKPIAHYFVRGKLTPEVLSDLLKTVIRSVRKTGFNIIASVCDQDPIHVEAFNLLRETDVDCADLNYYNIDSEKVYIVYDVPDLFKSMRNNLICFGELMMDTKTLNLSHLKIVEEKNSSTLHFTKISKEHVDKVCWSKKGITLAIEIFSNTVAGVLRGLSESKSNVENRDELFEAGEVIGEMDKLFNCTTGLYTGKKHPCIEDVHSASFHHDLWDVYKRKFKNTHFVNTNGQVGLSDVRCIDGFYITLSSFQSIWKHIEQKMMVALNLNCLSLYSLNDLFEIIKGEKQGDENHITCHYYELNICNMFIEPIKLYKKKSVVTDYSYLKNNEKTSEETDISVGQNSNRQSDMNYVSDDDDDDFLVPKSEKELGQLFERFETLPNVYISGYLAVKLLKNLKCRKCYKALEVTEMDSDLTHDYILLTELWTEKCPMIYPSKKLCMTVEKAVKLFCLDIRPILYIKNIHNYCVATMLAECDVSWMCGEHGNVMSTRLFRCLSFLLIRNHCRLQNQLITDKSNKQNKETSKSRRKKINLDDTNIKLQYEDQLYLINIQY